ncbi:hypothetical protein RRG08_018344 [Elysia crispata]|uniref:Uncharacterized protein n=1 Tax=Elysia crispata TaxID=231223 RepID=A0AAE1CPT2_9GAST|nr:hypothetical protein RRG08_018344 [Elysia crispata]
MGLGPGNSYDNSPVAFITTHGANCEHHVRATFIGHQLPVRVKDKTPSALSYSALTYDPPGTVSEMGTFFFF